MPSRWVHALLIRLLLSAVASLLGARWVHALLIRLLLPAVASLLGAQEGAAGSSRAFRAPLGGTAILEGDLLQFSGNIPCRDHSPGARVLVAPETSLFVF